MQTNASKAASPLGYFVLVFGLAAPLWLLGERELPPPLSLPASALAVFVPATAGAILSGRRAGLAGVKAFVRRAWDFGRIRDRRWYAPAVLLAPAIYASSYGLMRLLGLEPRKAAAEKRS
jgi:uncharacterized protein